MIIRIIQNFPTTNEYICRHFDMILILLLLSFYRMMSENKRDKKKRNLNKVNRNKRKHSDSNEKLTAAFKKLSLEDIAKLKAQSKLAINKDQKVYVNSEKDVTSKTGQTSMEEPNCSTAESATEQAQRNPPLNTRRCRWNVQCDHHG